MKLTTSVTRLRGFKTCRRKTYLSDILRLRSAPVNQLEEAKETKMNIGTIIHKVLQESSDAGNLVISDEDIAVVEEAGYDLRRTCEKYLTDFSSRPEKVISKETDYMYSYNGVDVYARPDEIVQNEAGEVIVIDHKTTVSKGNTFARHYTSTRYQLLDYCTILHQSGIANVNNAEVRVAQVYGLPIEIPRNANGSLRKRVKDSTYDDYIAAIEKYGLNANDYSETLEELALKATRNSEGYKFYFKDTALEENTRQLNIVIDAFKEEFSKPIEHFMDVVGADNASCNKCIFKTLCETGRNFNREVSEQYKAGMFVIKEDETR